MKQFREMTDEELAIFYINGNNRAFDLLLARNQSKLFSYILFVVRNEDVANDIFQETFVKIITRLQEGKYVPSGKFGAWIMRIAHNVIMDWYRSQKADKIVEATRNNDLSNIGGDDMQIGNIENQFITSQTLSDIKRMMNLLPPSQREVVFMRFYQEMSFKEIAQTTGVSINTSLGRMRYALLNLRKMVREHKVSLQLV
ncbi:MAG: sigma-70 family RNA polymerase sigma factor [Prevotella micans]|nr:sigma-70 family RNA polymerase sigma factor [Prevotella micans]